MPPPRSVIDLLDMELRMPTFPTLPDEIYGSDERELIEPVHPTTYIRGEVEPIFGSVGTPWKWSLPASLKRLGGIGDTGTPWKWSRDAKPYLGDHVDNIEYLPKLVPSYIGGTHRGIGHLRR